MRVVLATGIYPPEIGGPATYVWECAQALRAKGVSVHIVTFGEGQTENDAESVTRVSRRGGPLLRYIRYARALREHARDADIIEAFSSVSVGIPLWLAHLKRPKKILRLGGDFLWERATDAGDPRGLREWYEEHPRGTGFMNGLLRTFDAIIFSTHFQEEIYGKVYRDLPPSSVIENTSPPGTPTKHIRHTPWRLLSLGRFVNFKNLHALVAAMPLLPEARLTFVGSGPAETALREQAQSLELGERVRFLPPAHGDDKKTILAEQDLMVVPSTTDISPNAALEARAAGLPVLLTEETGLSRTLQDGMVIAPTRTPEQIAEAVQSTMERYETFADRAALPLTERGWNTVAEEHIALFVSLL